VAEVKALRLLQAGTAKTAVPNAVAEVKAIWLLQAGSTNTALPALWLRLLPGVTVSLPRRTREDGGRSGAATVGDVGDRACLHGAALLHDLKPLGEHRLKILDRPPFHEHVPVAARWLNFLR
jgi:hypothetical protein